MTTQVPASMTVEGVTAAQLAAKADASTVATLSATVTTLNTQKLTAGTAQATTSGTAKDFTSIPSWAKRITLTFNGVSLSATANLLVQIGTGGAAETTGYASGSSYAGSSVDGGAATSTSGFVVRAGVAAGLVSGTMTLVNVSGNIWAASFAGSRTDSANAIIAGGNKTLAGVLDMVRITSTSTDTFDAGSVQIMYE